MNSSYEKNNYGEVFEAIVDAFKPVLSVELGALHGYSTVHLGRAIKKNGNGILDVYDMFEDYKFNHGSMNAVQKLLDEQQLTGTVNLNKTDAFTVYEKYRDNSVSLLHVDLSNTGEIVKKIIDQWHSKMVHGGIILFEGGSVERDYVDWMIKYQKPKIKPELENNKIIKENYILGTYLPYPSLTMLLKRR